MLSDAVVWPPDREWYNTPARVVMQELIDEAAERGVRDLVAPDLTGFVAFLRVRAGTPLNEVASILADCQ